MSAEIIMVVSWRHFVEPIAPEWAPILEADAIRIDAKQPGDCIILVEDGYGPLFVVPFEGETYGDFMRSVHKGMQTYIPRDLPTGTRVLDKIDRLGVGPLRRRALEALFDDGLLQIEDLVESTDVTGEVRRVQRGPVGAWTFG